MSARKSISNAKLDGRVLNHGHVNISFLCRTKKFIDEKILKKHLQCICPKYCLLENS